MNQFTKHTVIGISFVLGLTQLATLANPQKVNAVTASDWNASRIIDDAVFFNPNSMSIQDIQNFLNAKMPACDTNGQKMYNSTQTRAQWAAANGKPQPPYICLKDFSQNIPGVSPDALCSGSVGAGTKSAATLIKEVATACNISPQVILITLQKEQSLITDDWPWLIQYTKATGMGCPDTSLGVDVDANQNGCYDDYEGFFKQIYYGARQFQRYVKQPDVFNYAVGRNSFVAYQANNASCGGTQITPQSQATAALYNYTPYQPNQAALDNLYGTGDACSAYGNRNFWRMFNDWFGSTRTDLFTSNVNWSFEELDGSAASISTAPGKLGFGVATIQDGPILRTFYHDYSTGDLKHAWADSTGWNFETLDGDSTVGGRVTNKVGKFVKTTIFQNKLYVAYYDETMGDLRLATRDLSSGIWTYETLDGSTTLAGRLNSNVGQDIALTAYGSSLQLFYSDIAGGNLRHAWLNGSVWSFENLDGTSNSVSGTESFSGQNVSVAVYGDTLQLFYYDGSRGNLKHAWADGRGWHFEHLDGDNNAISRSDGNVGAYIDTASFGGTLQVFYYDVAKGNLKHAWADGRGWHFEHLDGDNNAISRSDGNVGARPKTFGFNGKLYVFYSNPEKGILRQAWASSTGWSFAEIDGSYPAVSRNGATPVSTFAAVTPYGDGLQVFYFDSSQGILRHAWGVPQ